MPMTYLTLGVLALGCGGGSAQDNLLPNPGFEEADAERLPVAWRAQDWGVADREAFVEVTHKDVHRGEGALRVHTAAEPADYGIICLPIEVGQAAGSQLRVSLFYHTRGLPRAHITIYTFAQPYAEEERGTPPVQMEQRPLSVTERWRQLAWTFECEPTVQEALVAIRLTGTGDVLVDDMLLRTYPGGAWLELAAAGVAIDLGERRQIELRLHNDGPRRAFQVVGQACYGEGRERRELRASAEVGAGDVEPVALDYKLDFAEEHVVELALFDEATGEPLDGLLADAAPLLSGRMVQPSFHSTILASDPVDSVVAEGTLNATPDVAERLELTAQVIGLGLRATEGNGLTRTDNGLAWRLEFPASKLLRGGYSIRVEARSGDRVVGVADVPFFKVASPNPPEAQAACDAEGRLIVAGAPFFVQGIYNVRELEDLQAVAEHGYNVVAVPSHWAHTQYMKQAAELGLHVVVCSPHTPVGDQPDSLDWWAHAADRWGVDPTLLGWHLVARPDLLMMPPGVFRAQGRSVRDVDLHHPSMALISTPSLYRAYGPSADILVAAFSPVPSTPLGRIASYMQEALCAAGPGQPVWAGIQATGRAWLYAGPYDPETSGRAPTGEEHRVMSVLALVHGAHGLLDYAYSVPDIGGGEEGPGSYRIQAQAPELWTAIKETNELIAAHLAPVVLRGTRLGANVAGTVHVGAWELEGRTTVAAVNVDAAPSVAQFEVPGRPIGELTPLDGGEAPEADGGGRFTATFGPHEVRLYAAG